jgi:glycosyltransferase involved in cell wall biosynthesis
MKNLRTEISIGIPAYQAEGNIGRLLRSLSVQKERNILVEEILVYADACTDNTVSEVKKVRNKKKAA